MRGAKRTHRQAEQRLPWQQRRTLSVEAQRIVEQQEQLRAAVRTQLIF